MADENSETEESSDSRTGTPVPSVEPSVVHSVTKSKSKPDGTKSSVEIIGYVTSSVVSPRSSSPLLNFSKINSESVNKLNLTDGKIRSAPQNAALFERRSPFVRDPPQLEERRERIVSPNCLRDYILNFRENLADFQENHGFPRSRDYSFLSLGLALAQETGHALYAVIIMITELFPVLAILSLIIRFSLDKIIEILEAEDSLTRVKKIFVFIAETIVIVVPAWILIGTVIVPVLRLVFSIFKKFVKLTADRKRIKCSVLPACGSSATRPSTE